MFREKFFRQLADLDVVASQPGQVFDKHSGDIPGFNSGYHFLKSGPLHSSARDPIIHEKQGICITFFFCCLLEYLLLILDAVGLGVHVIVAAQQAIEGGCAKIVITRQFQNVLLPRVSDNQYFQVYCTSDCRSC